MPKRKSTINKTLQKRKPVAPGTKKDEPAFKEQHSRAGIFNALASAIHNTAKQYGGRMVEGGFYNRLQSRLRKETGTERVLMLGELDGMELRERYRLGEICSSPAITVSKTKKDVEVRLAVKVHPGYPRWDWDCYYFEVILMSWNRYGKMINSSKKTAWIYPEKDKPPSFRIPFAMPGAVEWLVFLRVSLGINKEDMDMMDTVRICIMQTGSFTKAGKRLLEAKWAARKEANTGNGKESVVEEERVMPEE